MTKSTLLEYQLHSCILNCEIYEDGIRETHGQWLLMGGSNYTELTGEILVFWINGRLWEVTAEGGLTVLIILIQINILTVDY